MFTYTYANHYSQTQPSMCSIVETVGNLEVLVEAGEVKEIFWQLYQQAEQFLEGGQKTQAEDDDND